MLSRAILAPEPANCLHTAMEAAAWAGLAYMPLMVDLARIVGATRRRAAARPPAASRAIVERWRSVRAALELVPAYGA